MDRYLTGATIKALREKQGLTQAQLAERLAVSDKAVSKWETGAGYPDITLLPRIANYFGITVDELIGNDAVTREEDIRSFTDWFLKQPDIRSSWAERLAKAKEYYRKYAFIDPTVTDYLQREAQKWETNASDG